MTVARQSAWPSCDAVAINRNSLRRRPARATAGVLASLVIAGCAARDSDVFGRTYNECVLTSARDANEPAVQLILDACRRHFERADVVEVPATATLEGGAYGERYVQFVVQNPSSETILTQVEITVTFNEPFDLRAAVERRGAPAERADTETRVWVFDAYIEPGRREAFRGTFSSPLRESLTGALKVIGRSRRKLELS